MQDTKENIIYRHHVRKMRNGKLAVIVLALVLLFTTSSSATIYDRESLPLLDNPRDAVSVRILGMLYPPIANDDAVTVLVDSVDNIIDVLADDFDPEGDPLTIINVTSAANGTVTTNGSVVLYTPTYGFAGIDTFTYTISDGNGGTDTADVRVTVQELSPVLLIGLISNVSIEYNFTSFNARFMVSITSNPFAFTVYSSDEFFVVSNEYFGLLRMRIIFGFFPILPSPFVK